MTAWLLCSLKLPQKHQSVIIQKTDEQCGEIERSVEMISKKNVKLLVWESFRIVSDNDGRPTDCFLPKCKLCFKDVSEKFSNISNLLKYLHLHHRHEFTEISKKQSAESSRKKDKSKEGNQPTLQHCFEHTRKYSSNSKEH